MVPNTFAPTMPFLSTTSTSKDDPCKLIGHIETTHGTRKATMTCEQTMHVLWRTKSHRYQLP
jgi:hypothetical protein